MGSLDASRSLRAAGYLYGEEYYHQKDQGGE